MNALLTCTPHEQEGAYVVEANLRSFKPLPAFVIRHEHPLLVRDEELDPIKLAQGRGPGAEPKIKDNQLLAILEDGQLTVEWRNNAERIFEMPTSTFYRHEKALVKAGKIRKVGQRIIKEEYPKVDVQA